MLIDGTAEQDAALRALVGRLDDTAALLAGIRDTVADAWDDAAGREWTGRLDLVGREVRRIADETTDELAGPRCPGGSGPGDTGRRGDAADDLTGMRLPGLTGTRVGARRGPVAPTVTPIDPPESR